MRGPSLVFPGRQPLIRVSAPLAIALNWAFILKFKWRTSLAGWARAAAALSL